MKKLILFSALFMCVSGLNAQSEVADSLARKMALRIKDSLGLSPQEESMVYQANLQIAKEKEKLWNEFRASPNLRIYLQKAENRRDSLYKRILSRELFLNYLNKKPVLISSN